MKNQKTLFVVNAAVIAALYVVMTYISSAFNLAYGPIQFRLSEVLNVFAVFTPAAIPGLTIGCLLGNLGSPYGAVDIVVGTTATLLAAVCAYFTRKIRIKNIPWLSFFFPVIFNAVLVGMEIVMLMPEGFQLNAFIISGAEVGLGELVMCYVFGVPLYLAIVKSKLPSLFKNK